MSKKRKKANSLRQPLPQPKKKKKKKKQTQKRAGGEAAGAGSSGGGGRRAGEAVAPAKKKEKKKKKIQKKQIQKIQKIQKKEEKNKEEELAQQQQQLLSDMGPLEVGSKALVAFVRGHPQLSFLGNGKVACAVTAHECPADLATVRAHLASKRYRLNEGYARDYGHLRPFIVDHESDRRKLLCLLTGHVLNKIPDQLALHVNSKKFVRLKAERQARDETRRKKKAARAAKLAARHEAKQGQGEGEDDNLSSDSDEEASHDDDDFDF